MCEQLFLCYEAGKGKRAHTDKPAIYFCVPWKRYFSLWGSLNDEVLAGEGAIAAVAGGDRKTTLSWKVQLGCTIVGGAAIGSAKVGIVIFGGAKVGGAMVSGAAPSKVTPS